jgi:predicted Zn-dependent peptidase
VPDQARTIRRVKALTADDVQRVARMVVRPNRMSLATIGPALDERRLARSIEMSTA